MRVKILAQKKKHAHTLTYKMGKPAYKKCQQLLRTIKKDYELEIGGKDLVRIISLSIGADQRTTDNYVDYLIRFGMLQSKGNGVFKILK